MTWKELIIVLVRFYTIWVVTVMGTSDLGYVPIKLYL